MNRGPTAIPAQRAALAVARVERRAKVEGESPETEETRFGAGEDSVELSQEALDRAAQAEQRAAAALLGGDTDTEQTQESRGGEAADPGELSQEQEEVVVDLKARDREVRDHENAHAAAGGAHAGRPTYSYEVGPDGQRYAVGGEVSIDVSAVSGDSGATINKMRAVQAAALSPASPSGQDRAVAAQAMQTMAAAQREEASGDDEEGTSVPDGESGALGARDDVAVSTRSVGMAAYAQAARPPAFAEKTLVDAWI